MGEERPFSKEQLVVPMLLSPEISFTEVVSHLVAQYGRVDSATGPIDFDFTDYYSGEMGGRLTRYIVAFCRLIDPQNLSDIKRFTNQIERSYATGGNRRANLDPGLLCLDRLVLASTKNNGRRIPLRDGIYAEITLVYHHGDFHPLEWTYPDFASRAYRDYFSRLRNTLRDRLRSEARSDPRD